MFVALAMKSWTHRAIQAMGCVASVALTGCVTTTTTALQLDQLPALGESTLRHPDGWHDTIDVGGNRVTLKGRIETVTLLRPRGEKGDVLFRAPFSATVQDGKLTLRDHKRDGAYPLSSIDLPGRNSQEDGKLRRSLVFSSCLPVFLFKSIHDPF